MLNTVAVQRGPPLLVSSSTVSRSGGEAGGGEGREEGFKWEISQKPILVNIGHGVQGSFLLHQPLLHLRASCY